MALFANSTPASVVQHEALLQGSGEPGRLLPVDLFAGSGGNPLSSPVPLPSLSAAFSRRRAIFGAVALAAAPVAVLSALASTVGISDSDARLMSHCAKFHDLEAVISALCDGYPGVNCDAMPGWNELEGRQSVVLYEITETPAATLAGIAAKARVLQVNTVREDFEWIDVLSASIANDVIRLHGGAHV